IATRQSRAGAGTSQEIGAVPIWNWDALFSGSNADVHARASISQNGRWYEGCRRVSENTEPSRIRLNFAELCSGTPWFGTSKRAGGQHCRGESRVPRLPRPLEEGRAGHSYLQASQSRVR